MGVLCALSSGETEGVAFDEPIDDAATIIGPNGNSIADVVLQGLTVTVECSGAEEQIQLVRRVIAQNAEIKAENIEAQQERSDCEYQYDHLP